jgi:hypothetical protein
MRYILVILLTVIFGCGATTKITGFSDPAYSNQTYSSTVVFASNLGLKKAAELESKICSKFMDRGTNCHSFLTLFPPTREYTADNVFASFSERGIDSLIMLTAGGDYSSSQIFAYQAYGSAYNYGGFTSAQATSIPLRSYYRKSEMRIVVIDSATREVAWIGDAKTEGEGMVNITDNAFQTSLSTEIVRILFESPHFVK